MRILIFTCCLLSLCIGCSSKQPAIALNEYARIDHAPDCGERKAALIVGKETLLCPLDEARYNGDSLVARSEGKCYFIDLQPNLPVARLKSVVEA